jgi:hypothetical protein
MSTLSLDLRQPRDDPARDDCQNAANQIGSFLGGAAERELALGRFALRQPSSCGTSDPDDGVFLGYFQLVDTEPVLNARLASGSPIGAPRFVRQHLAKVLFVLAAQSGLREIELVQDDLRMPFRGRRG